jgi:LAO/AO transport system kinase
LNEIAAGVLKGQRVAISKAISSIENRDENSRALLKELFPHTGKAFVLGVTGPPGTGKSSLVNELAKRYRSRGAKVAILAIDPTSPVSGGAILGDRVRMIEHSLDSGVYIRSMASRGDEGGLSHSARNAIRVLDAAGFDLVIVETVGIGQAEVQIVGVADLVIVVLMPELGDEVQAAKAGLMEIGNIFVVNKSDLPGADKVIYNIFSILSTRDGWKQASVKASAKTGAGISELVDKIEEFRASHREAASVGERKLTNLREELLRNVALNIDEIVESKMKNDAGFKNVVAKVAAREIDPESATDLLVQCFVDRFQAKRKKTKGLK